MPPTPLNGNMNPLRFSCPDPPATAALAARLAIACEGRSAVIVLCGPLGAGKTWFAAAFGRQWGSTTPLTSPTFTLLHEHRRTRDERRLYHLDGYRLETPAEARALGIDDCLAYEAILLVEWPERFGPALPAARITVAFCEPARGGRQLSLWANGDEAHALLQRLPRFETNPA